MVRAFVPSTRDVRALLELAIPIAALQVGLMLMGVVDTIFVGHVSARELAAAALGNLYFVGLFMFSIGAVWAVDPIVSQALGARDAAAAALGVQRGLVLAALLGVAGSLLCVPAEWIFRALHQPAAVIPRAAAFVHVSAPSLPPGLMFVALRQSLQAMKRTNTLVGVIVLANLLNAGLDWVLVFGHWGLPAMGAPGSALASSITRYVMLGALLVVARRELRPVLRPWRPEATALGPLMRTLRLGLPIGAQNLVEFTTFGGISVLAGWFGAEAVAGHQVAINLASFTYMVPLGFGSASAVLVGRAIGEQDMPHARRVAASALVAGAAYMSLSACVLLVFPGAFARAYTSVPAVIGVAAALIPIAGLFQVFDGLQVVAAGVLRGAGETRAPLVANVLGFWLVGMPVSLWLGFRAGLGVVGLWWGFVAGLAAVAVFMVRRVHSHFSRPVARVSVEGEPA
ncbi:MAG: MATE family efflux transporter [Deltaproteobacteria bacterium]|nr:MAG: MATE family efflux transporter [Deltaproteobacteria bacterium]